MCVGASARRSRRRRVSAISCGDLNPGVCVSNRVSWEFVVEDGCPECTATACAQHAPSDGNRSAAVDAESFDSGALCASNPVHFHGTFEFDPTLTNPLCNTTQCCCPDGDFTIEGKARTTCCRAIGA